MSVNTRKYRRHMAEYARLWPSEHVDRESMGVRGADLRQLLDVYDAAMAYGQSKHTRDSNCSAGDHDSCSARDALKALEALVGEPGYTE